jgi:membrane fusion protein (multidrug efflux system)
MNLKLSRFLICISIVFSLFSCHSGNNNKDSLKKGATAFEGYVIKPIVVDEIISLTGSLKPFEETVLMPEVSGRVVMINLPEGKFVKQGTLLVKLYDDDLQAQLLRSQTQLQIVEQTEKRQAELIKINGISQSDYDQTILQVHSYKADIEVLKVQVRKTEILAPYDGVIGLRNISMGAEVSPGLALATIREIYRLKLDFNVPEKYSSQIKTGMKANFIVEGSDNKYKATIMATEEGIDENTRNLKVRSVVENNNAILIPGAFANVFLKLNENKHALMVPTQAIIPQERNKSIIVAKNGKAVFIKVKTGVRQASMIEILNGVEEGDTVATTGILFLKPGATLKFSKVNN